MQIKENIIWLFLTIFIAFTVSVIQMYSRDITLDKVHRTEFTLLYKFFNENNNLNKNKLATILKPLSTKRGYAHFQVAIISKDICYENTQHYYNRPLLCETFKNIKVLEPFINTQEFKSSSVVKDLSESYLIKRFDKNKEYLIAKTNFYSKNNELSHFFYFLKNRYYQTNGINKIFEKGKFLFFIIFSVSLTLWLLNRLKYKKHYSQYKHYQENEYELQQKLLLLDTKYNETKRKRYENEELLEELGSKSEKEKENLKSTIKELKTSKDKLDKLFKKDESLIETLETESSNLRKKINMQLKKLDYYKQNEQNKQIFEKLERLNQLWRHDPTWEDRKNIESLVALKKSNLPFTITQGFIAFDKLVLNLVKQYDPYLIESQTNLNSNINMIFDNRLLPIKYKNNFHNVRKARNEWFHAGIYPSIETTNFLIKVLNDIDAEVFI